MARFQGKEVPAMLDHESDRNDSNEEVKEEEKREASEDFNAEEEDGGLDAYLDYIEEYQVFILNNNNNWLKSFTAVHLRMLDYFNHLISSPGMYIPSWLLKGRTTSLLKDKRKVQYLVITSQ